MRLRGRIDRHTPTIRFRIARREVRLGRGSRQLVIDTGFTDELALPRDLLRRLGARRMAREPFSLADGTETILDVFEIRVRVGRRRLSAMAIEGANLIGMTFLEKVWRELRVRLKARRVDLIP